MMQSRSEKIESVKSKITDIEAKLEDTSSWVERQSGPVRDVMRIFRPMIQDELDVLRGMVDVLDSLSTQISKNEVM